MKEAIKVVGIIDICVAIKAYRTENEIKAEYYYTNKRLPNGMIMELRKNTKPQFKM